MTDHPPLLHLIHTGDISDLSRLVSGYAWVATSMPEVRRMLDGHYKIVQARAAHPQQAGDPARCLHVHITGLPDLMADPAMAARVNYLAATGAAHGGQPTNPQPVTPDRITTTNGNPT